MCFSLTQILPYPTYIAGLGGYGSETDDEADSDRSTNEDSDDSSEDDDALQETIRRKKREFAKKMEEMEGQFNLCSSLLDRKSFTLC